MKTRTVIAFVVGVLVGATLITPVMAVIMPSWKKADVMPVVLVEYDHSDGFKPQSGNDSFPPVWKKDEVTPVAMVSYQGGSGKFVPLNTDSITVPAWDVGAVRPWAELVLNSFGEFEPRNTP